LKKVIFLIIASLLVLGLVLPGCEGEGEEELIYTFEDGTIVFGIAGEIGEAQGDMQVLGATMAAGAINAAGGVVIDGVAHNISVRAIDTKEVQDETGQQGKLALQAAIDDVDFLMGAFRTEAVEVYREVAVGPNGAGVIFYNCGASTEALQHSCLDDYDNYKYWFQATPFNEYQLADAVLRILNMVAIQLRDALDLEPGAQLTACIVAEDLAWSRDEQVPVYEAGLPALNITNLETYLVGSLDSASTQGAVMDIAANYPNVHFIIPVYSGTMGVVFAATLNSYITSGALAPMVVGINVLAQFKAPWADKLSEPPPGGVACRYEVILDTWAEDQEQTDLTLPFLAAFMSFAHDYPMYNASTYDTSFLLKACLEAVGYVEDGVGKAKADDMIAWLENPANAIKMTSGYPTVYPYPGTTSGGMPAMSEAQVRAMYGDIDSYGYTYNAADWVMPPHTTHCLGFGPGDAAGGKRRPTGIGAQWQWDETATQWKKVGVWPAQVYDPDTPQDELKAAGLLDQYGNWNFEHPGTKDLVLPDYVLTFHGGGS
jgi:branched-chain amino acid transport system substrate-binding protein